MTVVKGFMVAEPTHDAFWSYKTARLTAIIGCLTAVFGVTWPALSGVWLGTMVPATELKERENELKDAKAEIEKLKAQVAENDRSTIAKDMSGEKNLSDKSDLTNNLPHESSATPYQQISPSNSVGKVTMRVGDTAYFFPGDFEIFFSAMSGVNEVPSASRYDLVINNRHLGFSPEVIHNIKTDDGRNCAMRLSENKGGGITVSGKCR